ncbi:type III secretion system protein [compost metagenome]
MGTLAVMADASLSRTCCVVETSTGLVRGTLASQLAAVRQALIDAANSPLQTLLTQWAARS